MLRGAVTVISLVANIEVANLINTTLPAEKTNK